MPTSFPCQLKLCSASGGFAPSSDVTIYSLQDAIVFNSTDISILVECLPGYYWPPGSCPQVITYRSGRFTIPIPPTTGGFPIVIQLQGCLSLVSITLPAGSSAAAIQAAANTVILQVAAQQAQCDAINPPEDDPNDPDPGTPGGGGGGPNPLPKFFNQAVYYTCAMGLEFTGTLPSWVTIDAPNNRLVGVAQRFGGDTQAAANATAQTVLNAFAGAAFAEGTLTCLCEFDGGSTLPEATEGELYSFTLTLAVGTPGTFSIQSGALPDGLTINSTTGEIGGIPTESGFFNFTVRMDKAGAFCVAALELLSNATECLFNPSPTGCGEIGEPFSTTLTPVFQQLEGFPFEFSIVAGSLPPGLSLNGSTGVISGTPTTGGTFVYTVQLVNGPITCSKEYSCSITSTLCTNASDVGPWSVTFESPNDIGADTNFTMVGFNGSYHANAQTTNAGPIYGCHIYEINLSANVTNNTGAMCLVRATANYSYEVVNPYPGCLSQDSAVSVDVMVNGVPAFPGFAPLVGHANPPGGSGNSGVGLEAVNVFGLPPGVNVVELRVAVRGTRCSSFNSCVPSFITGTITLEPLPP